MNKRRDFTLRNYIFLLSVSFIVSCSDAAQELESFSEPGEEAVVQEISLRDNNTPTVDIDRYVLVNRPSADRAHDAAEILQVKRKWPLAMQSQRVADFDSILASDFTFFGEGRLLNRAAYIKDRTTASEWKITHVKYDNLTLQFFGDVAVLSYRNRVNNAHATTKAVETEFIDWVDIYRKEKGRWMICGAHVVEFRMQPESAQASYLNTSLADSKRAGIE
jgi:hypothetical protein